ncbi:MAG: hypothetical protein ACKO0Z_25500 [Betaproteobacteria bacterium]
MATQDRLGLIDIPNDFENPLVPRLRDFVKFTNWEDISIVAGMKSQVVQNEMNRPRDAINAAQALGQVFAALTCLQSVAVEWLAPSERIVAEGAIQAALTKIKERIDE